MIYAKYGAIVLVIVLLFGFGWYCGGLKGKAAVEAQGEAQLKAAVTALDSQATQRQAAEAKLEKVQNDYDAIKSTPDPISAGLAQRMYLIKTPGSCPMPGAPTVAAGTETPAAVPASDAGIVGLTQAVFDACSADAKQLAAMIQLAP